MVLYFGKQFLEEFKAQNERKANIDLKREERKQDEVNERAQRDREPQSDGGPHRRADGAQQCADGGHEGAHGVRRDLNEVLHADLANSQARVARAWRRRSTTSPTALTCSTRNRLDRKESEMTEMQAIAAIVLSFAVPFAVQLIKTEAMTGKAARILALGSFAPGGRRDRLRGRRARRPGRMGHVRLRRGRRRAGGLHAVQVGRHHIKWLDALLGVTVGGKE